MKGTGRRFHRWQEREILILDSGNLDCKIDILVKFTSEFEVAFCLSVSIGEFLGKPAAQRRIYRLR